MAATAYTINFNNSTNQEAAVTWKVAQYNATSISANPNFVPLTNQQWLKQRWAVDDIKAITQEYKQKLRNDAAEAVVFDPNA